MIVGGVVATTETKLNPANVLEIRKFFEVLASLFRYSCNLKTNQNSPYYLINATVAGLPFVRFSLAPNRHRLLGKLLGVFAASNPSCADSAATKKPGFGRRERSLTLAATDSAAGN